MNKVTNVIKMMITTVLNPSMWKNLPGRLVKFSKMSYHSIGEFASFFILLISITHDLRLTTHD